MVPLHYRAAVQGGQRVVGLDLEGVGGAAMVEVVAEAGHHQTKAVDLKRKIELLMQPFLVVAQKSYK